MRGRKNIMLYLDNAATSLKKPFCVYKSIFYNTVLNSVNAGHGGHFYSLRGAKKIYDAREKISALFGIKNPERIAFTHSATYALNMAIRGILKEGEHVVTTSMEHNSVFRTLNSLGEYSVVYADKEGTVLPQKIEKAITPKTRLIVVNHVSNVSGTIQDIKKIGEIAKKNNIPFLVDAAQSAGVVDIDVEDMGIDMLAFSGHKGMMGPLGTGVLYISDSLALKPVITGGTGSDSKNLNQPEIMPDMLESGTMNTPGIIALGRAAEYLKKGGITNIYKEENYLAMRFIEKVANIENVEIYGKKESLGRCATVSFNIKGVASTEIAQRLNDEYGICVRGGFHCAYPAHCTLGSEKYGAVRASFGAFNTIYAPDKLSEAVYNLSKKYK